MRASEGGTPPRARAMKRKKGKQAGWKKRNCSAVLPSFLPSFLPCGPSLRGGGGILLLSQTTEMKVVCLHYDPAQPEYIQVIEYIPRL